MFYSFSTLLLPAHFSRNAFMITIIHILSIFKWAVLVFVIKMTCGLGDAFSLLWPPLHSLANDYQWMITNDCMNAVCHCHYFFSFLQSFCLSSTWNPLELSRYSWQFLKKFAPKCLGQQFCIPVMLIKSHVAVLMKAMFNMRLLSYGSCLDWQPGACLKKKHAFLWN